MSQKIASRWLGPLGVSAVVCLGAVGLVSLQNIGATTNMRGEPSVIAGLFYMGNIMHSRLGCWPAPKPVEVDLQGKIVVVAGGSVGIGRSAAIMLSRLGADVHVLSRRGVENSTQGKGSITSHTVDLSSLQDIGSFAENFQRAHPRIDVLINNVMVMPPRAQQATAGFDLAVSVGLLGWRALTQALEPGLIQAAAMNGEARVINVVSAGMHLVRLEPAELQDLATHSQTWASDTVYDSIRAYCLVHRARVLLSALWAQDWASRGLNISSASVHPGWVDTPGLKGADAMQGFYSLMRPLLRSEEQGAETMIWLAASPDAKGPNQSGRYFWDRQVRSVDLPLAPTRTPDTQSKAVAQWIDDLLGGGLKP